MQGRPRFVGAELGRSGREAWTTEGERFARAGAVDPRPFDARLEDALEDLREAWAQTTFFLFDPDSWR